MKGVNRYIKIIWMVFQSRFLFAPNMAWWAQKWRIFMTLDLYKRSFFYFRTMNGKELHENCINGFSGKVIVWGNWAILDPKVRCLFNFAQRKRPRHNASHINGFSKKNVLGQMGHFGHRHVSPLTVDNCGSSLWWSCLAFYT